MVPAPDTRAKLRDALGGPADCLVRSPGRVNLIGEHTDYNDGLVLPGAVNRAITLAIRRLPADQPCRAIALDLNARAEFHLPDIHWGVDANLPAWARYVQGMAAQLYRQQRFDAFEVAFLGDVPIGAGMSSSAALCCGIGFAINQLYHLGHDRRTLARLAQQTEHVFAGANVGIMDQMANLLGQAGHFLLLDCRTLDVRPIPARIDNCVLVLLDSHVKHELVSTEYNLRRQQCERAVHVIQQRYPEVTALRDVDLTLLNAHREQLDVDTFRRCSYVVQEIQRTRDAVTALEGGELATLGRLLNATHRGLRDDYNVSTPEIDLLQDTAIQQPGVLGSRLMGGGFGGCTLNLVRRDALDDALPAIQAAYRQRYSKSASAYVCELVQGTEEIDN